MVNISHYSIKVMYVQRHSQIILDTGHRRIFVLLEPRRNSARGLGLGGFCLQLGRYTLWRLQVAVPARGDRASCGRHRNLSPSYHGHLHDR